MPMEKQLFQANFEKFSFAETRHLNQLIDYGYYTQQQQPDTEVICGAIQSPKHLQQCTE